MPGQYIGTKQTTTLKRNPLGMTLQSWRLAVIDQIRSIYAMKPGKSEGVLGSWAVLYSPPSFFAYFFYFIDKEIIAVVILPPLYAGILENLRIKPPHSHRTLFISPRIVQVYRSGSDSLANCHSPLLIGEKE
ncbi:hypothetical protein K449DRAFT_111057 [Hypoxylon sp. EC38]|nr:hypothetical protein K449DRAFT_111057 [Hypoxylon sp. EC38]